MCPGDLQAALFDKWIELAKSTQETTLVHQIQVWTMWLHATTFNN